MVFVMHGRWRYGLRLAALGFGSLFLGTGCFGSFIAGKLVDESTCKARDLSGPDREAYLDIEIVRPDTWEVTWDGRSRVDGCDDAAGLGGSDGAFVLFDEVDGATSVGFILADDEGLTTGETPTALIIEGVDGAEVWAAFDCTTDVTTYEDLDNGYAYVEGAGRCMTVPLDDSEPELAAEYSFGNVVLIDAGVLVAYCC